MACFTPVIDCHTPVVDCHTITVLTGTLGRLTAEKESIEKQIAAGTADVEALKAIEEELRNAQTELVAEIKKKEADANATTAELKESIASLALLFRQREAELAAKIVEGSKIRLANNEQANENYKKAVIAGEVEAQIKEVKSEQEKETIKHIEEVKALETKIACLTPICY
jgi:hypothetical protein